MIENLASCAKFFSHVFAAHQPILAACHKESLDLQRGFKSSVSGRRNSWMLRRWADTGWPTSNDELEDADHRDSVASTSSTYQQA